MQCHVKRSYFPVMYDTLIVPMSHWLLMLCMIQGTPLVKSSPHSVLLSHFEDKCAIPSRGLYKVQYISWGSSPESSLQEGDVGIIQLDSRVLRGPSGTSGGLGMLVKESKVQPGLLVLQTLGHSGVNGVVPEAVGTEMGISPELLPHPLASALTLPTCHKMEVPSGRALLCHSAEAVQASKTALLTCPPLQASAMCQAQYFICSFSPHHHSQVDIITVPILQKRKQVQRGQITDAKLT